MAKNIEAESVLARLDPFEREIFEEIVGFGDARPWGAAVGAAREALVGAGLLLTALGDGLTPLGHECRKAVFTTLAERLT